MSLRFVLLTIVCILIFISLHLSDRVLSYELALLPSLNVGVSVLHDGISRHFSLVVLLIRGSICFYSRAYMEHDIFSNRFLPVLLLFSTRILVLVVRISMPVMLLG